MASDARPGVTARFLPRPIHHVGFHVPDLRVAIKTWVAVHRAGPLDLLEHVAFDECTSCGIPAVREHSDAFGRWGAVRVELQEVLDLRPAELARPITTAR